MIIPESAPDVFELVASFDLDGDGVREALFLSRGDDVSALYLLARAREGWVTRWTLEM